MTKPQKTLLLIDMNASSNANFPRRNDEGNTSIIFLIHLDKIGEKIDKFLFKGITLDSSINTVSK